MHVMHTVHTIHMCKHNVRVHEPPAGASRLAATPGPGTAGRQGKVAASWRVGTPPSPVIDYLYDRMIGAQVLLPHLCMSEVYMSIYMIWSADTPRSTYSEGRCRMDVDV